MEAPLGYSRLSPEVWKEIFAHVPMLWRAMCCRVCKDWQKDLEQPQQGQSDDDIVSNILVDYGLVMLCSVLATEGVDEVMRRIRLHYPSGIAADLGRMDQVRRFVQRHRGARIESVDEWMQLASQEPDAGWLCKGASRTKLEGIGKSLMRQVVGKPQGFSRLLDTLRHSTTVSSLRYSPDGRTIAIAGFDGTVCLLDAKTMEQKGTLAGHLGSAYTVAWSPDSEMIACGGQDPAVGEYLRLWSKSGELKGTLVGPLGLVLSVAWSPDGEMIACGGEDCTVRLWSKSGDTGTLSPPGGSATVYAVAWSPDGEMIASGSQSTVRLWSKSGELKSILTGHRGPVVSVAWSPDGETIASCSSDKSVRLWSKSGEHRGTLRHTDRAVAYSPGGSTIASGSWDNTVRLWDAKTMEEKGSLRGHSTAVTCIAYSPDGKRIASASRDRTVKIWDAETQEDKDGRDEGIEESIGREPSLGGEFDPEVSGHSDMVTCVAHSPDGKHIASASGDRSVKIWDAETKQELWLLMGHSGIVTCVAWSPDNEMIASGSCDNTVCLWDAKTMEHKGTLMGHLDQVLCVAYSPDSKHIASASDDYTVKIWDAVTMEELCSLGGHVASWQHLDPETKALAVKVYERSEGSNMTGQYIVAGDGNMVYVYRTDSTEGKQGKPLACFLSPARVTSASCKGTSLVVGCADGQVSRYLLYGPRDTSAVGLWCIFVVNIFKFV